MRALSFLLLVVTAGRALGAPLTLPELVERARKNDARVKESQAQLAWFRAKYDEARWAWFPRVESYVAVAGPTPEARNDGLGGPPRTAASLMYDLDFGQVGVQFRAGAEAVLPIYTFGKLDALEAAGAKGVQAGEALAVRAADEAELQVSQAFWGLSLARAGIGVIDETVKRLDDAKATLERLRSLDSEQVTQMDVYKLDFYRQQAEVQRAAARQGEAFALAAIRLLVAHPPNEPLEVATEALPEPRGGLDPVDALLDQALAHRPELRAIEAGVAAREQEVKLRERMYYPDFGIAGFARWIWTTSATRQRSPFAYDPYNDLSAGLALVSRYTWDFPQKSALLDGARAELDKMRAQRDFIRAGVRLELEKAWGEVSAAQVRFERQTLAEKSARRWATAAFAAFDLGTGDTRDLVESFSALASASAQRAQAQHDVQVALKALSRAVGQPVMLQVPYDVSPLPPPAAVTSPAK
ncbi:MAG: TolC family protein [Myxococcaceae bacterium]|nr:TolC family protein [Myxococcaceae bacterium]